MSDYRRVRFASDSTARSAILVIVEDGITKSLARIEKTIISPSRVFTKPDSDRALEIEPVFATAFPSARVPLHSRCNGPILSGDW